VVDVGAPGDPLGGGGDRDPVPGPDRRPDRQVGLAGAGYVGTNVMIRVPVASGKTQLLHRISLPNNPADWMAGLTSD
jgi:hypothetical protein